MSTPLDTAVLRAPESGALAERLATALGPGYTVERELGAGGFAVVFLVYERQLKRRLAVKVLRPDVTASAIVRERFRREAETIAAIVHPHIVPLYFVGEQDDLLWLAMPCIDGGSLADRLDRSPSPSLAELLSAFCEVADALALAHQRGIVHRDIKPQNVLIDRESGRAMLTDFGIARGHDSASLTVTGMVVGTPTYLAPEQLTGEPADHRVDIYAFGVMLYEALAGEAPFIGATPTAVIVKRLASDPQPIMERRPDIPPALGDLVDRCMARDPAERVADAGEIVTALSALLNGNSGALRSTTARAIARATAGIGTVTSADTRPIRPSHDRWYLLGGVGVAVLAWLLWLRFPVGRTDTALRTAPEVPRDGPADSASDQSLAGMVLLPAGQYIVGSDSGPSDGRPRRLVQLKAFFMARHEVSVGEYHAFVEAGRASPPWSGSVPDSLLPVTRVVLSEAAAYCAWKYPKGGRLPTEEEWEAAARGRDGREYPWGDVWVERAANVANAAGTLATRGDHPAGRTPEGIDDLIGNVWEWTSTPYTAEGSSPELYVIRGGAANSLRAVATSTYRGRARLSAARVDLTFTGFRCAATPPVPSP